MELLESGSKSLVLKDAFFREDPITIQISLFQGPPIFGCHFSFFSSWQHLMVGVLLPFFHLWIRPVLDLSFKQTDGKMTLQEN